MPMFYTEDEMAAERARRRALEDFLMRIGAVWEPEPGEDDKGRWTFDYRTEQLRAQRDAAEEALLSAGWRKPIAEFARWEPPSPSTLAEAAEASATESPYWQPPVGENRPGAFTTSRLPDPLKPGAMAARTILFPVLDAIALLAVIDRHAGPFSGSTRAAEAFGELEQAVEVWLDARAGEA